MKINNKRELQNIAVNHSADIDYKDFVKIYRKCTKKRILLTIGTTLPANDPLKFRKHFFNHIEITVADQLKIVENKINANQAQ